jgi:glycosyltransferase involved in cell wall biosynthesis
MRILQLITGLNVGGAEKVVFHLAENLSNDNDVLVICLSREQHMVDLFRKVGVDVVVIGMTKTPFSVIKYYKIIQGIIREFRPDIIHGHMFHAIIFACLFKLFNRNVHIVATQHSIDYFSIIWKMPLFLGRFLRRFDIVFEAPSKGRPWYNSTLAVIPNGVETIEYSGESKFERFTFICVGALREAKNYEALIKSLSFKGELSGCQLLIVGDGPLRSNLETLVLELGLDGHIRFLGLRSDVPKLLAKSHVYLLPSLWEGLPLALLEAGSQSLPAIVTPVGNVPNIINDHTGYLCDEVSDFEELMRYVHINYNQAMVKGRALRSVVRNDYSQETMIKAHRELYKSLIN